MVKEFLEELVSKVSVQEEAEKGLLKSLQAGDLGPFVKLVQQVNGRPKQEVEHKVNVAPIVVMPGDARIDPGKPQETNGNG